MNLLSAIAQSMGTSPCRLSGSLDATAVAGTATSSTITVTVPPGNNGQITIGNFIDVGTILLSAHDLNGAGFSNFTDPTIFTFTDGQTTALRTTGDGAGESRTYTLTDVTTGKVIATAVHVGA